MAGQKTDARDVYLGQRIAESRKRAALTQRRVARSFGMSAAQLQKYEKGTNRISAIHLEILSRMTGVPLAAFFEGMPRRDDVPPSGFADDPQHAYQEGTFSGLAAIIADHVIERFAPDTRRDFAAAVQALDRRLSEGASRRDDPRTGSQT